MGGFQERLQREFHTVSKAEKPAFDLKKFINNIYDKTFNTLEEINSSRKNTGKSQARECILKPLHKKNRKQARIIATQRLIDAEGNTIGNHYWRF